MRRVRVGVIGCGEAAQLLHLPALAQLSDRFEVTALCDVSATVLEGVGGLWGIDRRLSDHRALAELPEVDAVVICNPDPWHGDAALAAIAAGKDVLVEKPMCLGPRECDEIVAAAERAGAIVQVGYMRRHAPALAEAKALLAEIGDVRFARVHDVIGLNREIIDQTSRVIRGDDVPRELIDQTWARRAAMIEEALGPVADEHANAYGLLLGLGSHDASAMRDLLGTPRGVAYAAERRGGGYVVATVDYGDFLCHFEVGVDEIARYDTQIEVYGARHVLRIRWDVPYVRNLPTTLTVLEADDRGGFSERTVMPEWGDPFVEEWLAFHASVLERTQPRASAADFRHDLDLFGAMVGLMAR
jgi:predicted dehydrogenase